MRKNPIDRDALIRYIQLLGNPYAKSQLIGGEELDLDAAQTNGIAEGDVRTPTLAEREYARLQANQYTLLSVSIADARDALAAAKSRLEATVEKPAGARGISKKDFGEGCRRVFRHYIPQGEKGRLRRHHRDFITRNQNRSAAERNLLLHGLSKYDLSGMPGMQTQFNRERADLTDRKLRQIEDSLLGKKAK